MYGTIMWQNQFDMPSLSIHNSREKTYDSSFATNAHSKATIAQELQISPSAGDGEDVIDSAGGDWNDEEIPDDGMEFAGDSIVDNGSQSAQETGGEPATISDPNQSDASNQPDANLVDESELDLDSFQINVVLDNLDPLPGSIMNDLLSSARGCVTHTRLSGSWGEG